MKITKTTVKRKMLNQLRKFSTYELMIRRTLVISDLSETNKKALFQTVPTAFLLINKLNVDLDNNDELIDQLINEYRSLYGKRPRLNITGFIRIYIMHCIQSSRIDNDTCDNIAQHMIDLTLNLVFMIAYESCIINLKFYRHVMLHFIFGSAWILIANIAWYGNISRILIIDTCMFLSILMGFSTYKATFSEELKNLDSMINNCNNTMKKMYTDKIITLIDYTKEDN